MSKRQIILIAVAVIAIILIGLLSKKESAINSERLPGSFLVTINSKNNVLSISKVETSDLEPSDIIVASDLPYLLLVDSKDTSQAKIPVRLPSGRGDTPSPDWFDSKGNQIYFPSSTANSSRDYSTIVSIPRYSDTVKLELRDSEESLLDTWQLK